MLKNYSFVHCLIAIFYGEVRIKRHTPKGYLNDVTVTRAHINTALKFLKDGEAFTVDGLRLGVINVNVLTVTGWSQYSNFLDLTKSSSLEELSEKKRFFSDMIDASVDLKTFITNMSIDYILCYDDGGKTSIVICSENDGVL